MVTVILGNCGEKCIKKGDKKGAVEFYGISTMIGYLMPNPFHTFFFHRTTCEITCDTLSSSAANQGDNTVSAAQGGTATPGATKQLFIHIN